MTIYTDGMTARPRGISEIESGLGGYLGAKKAEAAAEWPIQRLADIGELRAASGERGGFGFGTIPTGDKPNMLSLSDANAKLKAEGLEHDVKLTIDGVAEPALEIMIRRAKARREREATIERGPDSLRAGALGVGTSFLVGAVDPLNIAASFIPVVGQTKYAKQLADAGVSNLARAGVRARVGAIEGAVGQALIEPINAFATTQEGGDYTLTSALHSVMFGAALGTGLRTGGGAVADTIRMRRGRPLFPFDVGEAADDHPTFDTLSTLKPYEPLSARQSAGEGVLPVYEPTIDSVGNRRIPNTFEDVLKAGREQWKLDITLTPEERARVEAGGDSSWLYDPAKPDAEPGTARQQPTIQSIDAESAAKVWLNEVPKSSNPALQHHFLIHDEHGPAAIASVTVDGKRANIDNIQSVEEFTVGKKSLVTTATNAPSENALGPSVIRRSMREFLKRFPGVTEVSGNRVSGARFGGEMVPIEDGLPVLIRKSPHIEALDDLPPRAKEDLTRVAIGGLVNGEPVRVGEVLNAAAADNPRIKESIDLVNRPEARTSARRVGDEWATQLRGLGFGERYSKMGGALMAARYAVRGWMLGRDPHELYQADGVVVRKGGAGTIESGRAFDQAMDSKIAAARRILYDPKHRAEARDQAQRQIAENLRSERAAIADALKTAGVSETEMQHQVRAAVSGIDLAAPEKILAAATLYKGKVYTGPIHSDAVGKIGLDAATGEAEYRKMIQGFVTSRGRFIGRAEATVRTGFTGEATKAVGQSFDQSQPTAPTSPITQALDAIGERGSQWVDVPEGRIYLRTGERPNIGRTLEIPNIEFDEGSRGKGSFTRYLTAIEKEASDRSFDAVYVEQIFNKRLEGYLRKRGYRDEPVAGGGMVGFVVRPDQATLYKRISPSMEFMVDEPYRLSDGRSQLSAVESDAADSLAGAGNRHGRAIADVNEHLQMLSRNSGRTKSRTAEARRSSSGNWEIWDKDANTLWITGGGTREADARAQADMINEGSRRSAELESEQASRRAHWEKVLSTLRQWQRDNVTLAGRMVTEEERLGPPRSFDQSQGPERLVGATVIADGRVFIGHSHVHAMDEARKAIPGYRGEFESINAGGMPVGGFITSRGRIVSREEAYRIRDGETAVAGGKATAERTPGLKDRENRALAEKWQGKGLADIGRSFDQSQPTAPTSPREFFQIAAYHGSPHDFDVFDLSRIGTGEGAQAYGYGLYFAESKGVAEAYKKNLAPASADIAPSWQGNGWQVTTRDGGNFGREFFATKEDAEAFAAKFDKGVNYKVTIKAEREHMLDWDKPLAEQTPHVQAAVKHAMGIDYHGKFDAEKSARKWNEHKNANAGDAVTQGFISPDEKRVSVLLKEAGVPGISYLDQGSRFFTDTATLKKDLANAQSMLESANREVAEGRSGLEGATAKGAVKRLEGRIEQLEQKIAEAESGAKPTSNFVVFDDKLIDITHKNGEPLTRKERTAVLDQARLTQQPEPEVGAADAGPRGRITLSENKAIIDLFNSADKSTFLHEAGHLFLDQLARDAQLANVPQALKDDLGTVLRWLGVSKVEDIGVPQHEQWARGFEQYLASGEAPSNALVKAFQAFKEWLGAIYRSLRDLGEPLPDDIRAVMDRMLATDAEIAERRGPPKTKQEAFAELSRRESDQAQPAPEKAEHPASLQPQDIPEGLQREVPKAAPEADIVTTEIKASKPRGPRAKPEGQWSLWEFIASKGGIDANDPMIGDVISLLGKKNKLVPGFGPLIRVGGMRLDRAREAAVGAGYLHDAGELAGRETTTDINTLLAAFDTEARGQKVFRAGFESPAKALDPDEQAALRAEHARDVEDFHAELAKHDVMPDMVSGDTRELALQFMRREGLDAVEAYDRAVMERVQDASDAEKTGRIDDIIPGWDVTDDGRPIPASGRDGGQVSRSEGQGTGAGTRSAGADRGTPEQPKPLTPVSASAKAAAKAEQLAVQQYEAAFAAGDITPEQRVKLDEVLKAIDAEADARARVVREGAGCLAGGFGFAAAAPAKSAGEGARGGMKIALPRDAKGRIAGAEAQVSFARDPKTGMISGVNLG